MEAHGDSLHIVVFPWLAFGHMLPFLELSKSLARRGHRISFISTPKNIQRLPNLPSDISHLIHLVPLTLPQVDGKPENAEATSDLPMEDGDYLMKALDGLEQPFANFIRDSSPKPDWIIQDFFQHWIPKLATESGVPSISFSTLTAAALTFIGNPADIKSRGSLTASPPWVPFPSKVAYRLHELLKMAAGPHRPNPVASPLIERMELAIVGSSAVAIRSCEVERKEDGSFTRNEVAKAINLIMVEEGGGSYRKKAQEAKGFTNKECQEKYVDKFVDYLLTHRTSHG